MVQPPEKRFVTEARLTELAQDIIAATIAAGTGISVNYNDTLGVFTITCSITDSTDPEVVRDTIAAALVAGDNIDIVYDDSANTITITAADTSLDAEGVRDTMAAALVAGSGITITPNDGADTITIASTTDAETVRDTIGAALVAGSNIEITVDDSGNTITIDAIQDAGAKGEPGIMGPLGGTYYGQQNGGTLTLNPSVNSEYTITALGSAGTKITLAAEDFLLGSGITLNLIQDGDGNKGLQIPSDWIGGDQIAVSTPGNSVDTLVVWRSSLGMHIAKIMSGSLPPALWTPNSLPNHKAWFHGNGFSADLSSLITSWVDLWNGFTLAAASGKEPLLGESHTHKFLEFDGDHDYMDGTFTGFGEPWTVGMVVKMESNGVVLGGATISQASIYVEGGNWKVHNGTPLVGAARIDNWVTVIARCAIGPGPTTDYLDVDGSVVSGEIGTAKDLTNIRLFGDTSSNPQPGRISELILLNASIDDTAGQYTKLKNYLNGIRDDLNGV